MKTLFIDCGMGAAGDMLTAALLEVVCRKSEGGADRDKIDEFAKKFNSIGIPGVEMKAVMSVKQGVTGTHVHMLINGQEEEAAETVHDHEHHHHDHEHHHHHEHDHEHHHHHDHVHRTMEDIRAIIAGLDVEDKVKEDVLAVYTVIAEAEGAVHGAPAGEVHFHEVGAMDAVADVTAVCMLMNELAPEQVIATPVATGYGSVRCAHGILPVPAPATANILKGMPVYAGDIEGELCTPTGAALIRHFATEYSNMPAMRMEAIGYGMGTKDFEKANCIRAIYGETF